MRPIRLAMCLLLAFVAQGCAYVTAESPVGETPVHLAPDELTGAWHGDNVTITLEATDASDGRYRAQWTEDGIHKSLALLLRAHQPPDSSEGQPWRFWNVLVADFQASEGTGPDLDDDSGERHDHYYWGRFRLEGDRLIGWAPSAERLASLVKNGALPGELDGDSIRLGTLTPAQIDRITSDKEGVLLDWEYPLVLYRIIQD